MAIRPFWNRKKVNAGFLNRIDSGCDSLGVRSNLRPVAASKNEYGQFGRTKVLLMLEILVTGHQDFKPSGFCQREQFAIFLVAHPN
jgi:hypothetical protein